MYNADAEATPFDIDLEMASQVYMGEKKREKNSVSKTIMQFILPRYDRPSGGYCGSIIALLLCLLRFQTLERQILER